MLYVCRKFIQSKHDRAMLLVQCDSGDRNINLIACARFLIADELRQHRHCHQQQQKRHVVLIVQLPRIAGGCFIGFQVSEHCSQVSVQTLPQSFHLYMYNTVSAVGGLEMLPHR